MNLRIRHIERVIAGILVCCSALFTAPLLAQSATADQVKAAYLFNFAKFIEWPAGVFDKADAPMRFCTLGRSPAADELDSTVRGKSINGHTIQVKHLRGPEEIKGCHLVFLAVSASKQQQKLLQTAQGSPVLLVAETPGFARAGGTIDFIWEDGRLLFEVNVNAAEGVHLKISSKLLALARIVLTAEEKQSQ
ncbi:MAG TPA: YfiR family protein [Alphaproteobacteria bacterium]|nr:YfiR family protein [Alphaproteobacteria bacterium]